jgi:hypothetical protein
MRVFWFDCLQLYLISQTLHDLDLTVRQQSRGTSASASPSGLCRPLVQWTLYWVALYCFALLSDSLPAWLLFIPRLEDILCCLFLLFFHQGLEAWTARVPEIYARIAGLVRTAAVWIAAKRPDRRLFAFVYKCYVWVLTAGGKQ